MSESDARVKAMLENAELKYRNNDNGDFLVLMGLDNDRSQQVFVRSQTHEIGNREYREVVSPVHVGEMPEPKVMAYCLQQNDRVHYGSWRLQLFNDETAALVFGVNLEANAGPDELKFIIKIVAQTADALEQKLSDKDDF